MDTLYTTNEAAIKLKLSTRTLERFRKDGVGPYFIRQGYRIYYTPFDLKQWQQENRSI